MATIHGFCAIALWGALALLGHLSASVPPLLCLALAFGIGSLLMVVSALLPGGAPLARPRLTARAWIVGVGALFSFHLLYILALRHAPVVEVSLIVYLWPLLLALMLAPPARRGAALAGGLLGFAGVVVLVLPGESGAQPVSGFALLPGHLLALACAFIWSAYSRYLTTAPGSTADMGWLSAVVAVLAFVAHLLLEASPGPMSPAAWIGIVLLGLGPMGGAFYLWDSGMRHGNRMGLALASYAAPLLSAVALAFAGLNDWRLEILVAVALIVTGGCVAGGRFRRVHRGLDASTAIRRSRRTAPG